MGNCIKLSRGLRIHSLSGGVPNSLLELLKPLESFVFLIATDRGAGRMDFRKDYPFLDGVLL